ncbi:MAG: OsmC family protein [Actinomycetota bacterium]
MATRTGNAEWKGDLQGGTGTLQVGEGFASGDYSFESRFQEGEGTNPEELIAAAHAACFSMELSNILSEAGHKPDSVKTTASVHLRMGDEGAQIHRIDLKTEGSVPGLGDEHFQQHAEEAKAGCPVSKALAGVGEITLDAKLAG